MNFMFRLNKIICSIFTLKSGKEFIPVDKDNKYLWTDKIEAYHKMTSAEFLITLGVYWVQWRMDIAKQMRSI